MTFNTDIHYQKNIAVALSGGPDSMALAHMMCEWAAEHDCQIHLLSVNHNLRPEAADEAQRVAQWVADFPNAEHHVLTWDFDEKPDTSVMEKARNARYDLMADYCSRHDIQTLAVAHHADDNLETFMFRLCKGSGLDGLCAMREWGAYSDIKIYRPLLSLSKTDLIDYCDENGLDYITDPSNKNEQYARPRLRKALEAEGFDSKRFAKTLGRMQRGQDALDWLADRVIEEIKAEGAQRINYEILQVYPLDIRIRVIQKLLMQIGGTANGYPPKMDALEEVIASGLNAGKSATLYGCVLSLSKDGKTLEIKGS